MFLMKITQRLVHIAFQQMFVGLYVRTKSSECALEFKSELHLKVAPKQTLSFSTSQSLTSEAEGWTGVRLRPAGRRPSVPVLEAVCVLGVGLWSVSPSAEPGVRSSPTQRCLTSSPLNAASLLASRGSVDPTVSALALVT